MNELLEARKSLHGRIEQSRQKCKELENQLENMQPLANIGLAWAMTAHELNNLLTPVINYAQLALNHPEDTELASKALQKALLLGQRSSRMIEKMLVLAGSEQMETAEYSLSILLDEVFEGLGRDFSKDKIRVTRILDPEIKIRVDVDAFRQVLMNLVLNAYHAMKNGGQLTIEASQENDVISIEVMDTGCGIPPEHLHSIFDVFFTAGKQNGKGVGLAFCRKVIESHGGYISADSCVGQGTHFKIVLPKRSE